MVGAHIEKIPVTTFFESILQEHILKTFLKYSLICHSSTHSSSCRPIFWTKRETFIIIVPQILSLFVIKQKTTVYKCQIDFCSEVVFNSQNIRLQRKSVFIFYTSEENTMIREQSELNALFILRKKMQVCCESTKEGNQLVFANCGHVEKKLPRMKLYAFQSL